MPDIWMSSSTQPGDGSRSRRFRNSSAEAQPSARWPADFSSRTKALRTDASSSTTKTVGRGSVILAVDLVVQPQTADGDKGEIGAAPVSFSGFKGCRAFSGWVGLNTSAAYATVQTRVAGEIPLELEITPLDISASVLLQSGGGLVASPPAAMNCTERSDRSRDRLGAGDFEEAEPVFEPNTDRPDFDTLLLSDSAKKIKKSDP